MVESQPVSRVLSRIIIHLDWKSPSSLKQPTRKRRGPRHGFPIWSCSGWGLPCRFCYHKRGALLPHHFTLTSLGWRYTFCCTGRGLAPPDVIWHPALRSPDFPPARNTSQRLSSWLASDYNTAKRVRYPNGTLLDKYFLVSGKSTLLPRTNNESEVDYYPAQPLRGETGE